MSKVADAASAGACYAAHSQEIVCRFHPIEAIMIAVAIVIAIRVVFGWFFK